MAHLRSVQANLTKKKVLDAVRYFDLPLQATRAIRVIDEYLSERDPEDLDLLFLKGNILETIRRFDAARRVYSRILRIDRKNPLALINLGDCYSSYKKQEYRKSILFYDRALRLLESGHFFSDKEDEFVEACTGKADALLELKCPKDAIKCLVHGLNKYPTDIVLGGALQRAQKQYSSLQEKKFGKQKRTPRKALRVV